MYGGPSQGNHPAAGGDHPRITLAEVLVGSSTRSASAGAVARPARAEVSTDTTVDRQSTGMKRLPLRAREKLRAVGGGG
jgi:hypothetical protein